MPYLDDSTMAAIEADLAAAHQSLAHGGFDIKRGLVGQMEDGIAKSGVKLLEMTIPAAAFSYANARSAGGEMKIGPVPVDLGAGLVLAGLSLWLDGGWDEDLLNIAGGALASYAARTGAAFGAAAAAAAGTAPATATSGLEISGNLPAHGPHNQPMLAARLRRMHHHVSGQQEISGATAGQPVPPGTQRFVVQRVA